jgi:flagellar hook-length control protein FliK
MHPTLNTPLGSPLNATLPFLPAAAAAGAPRQSGALTANGGSGASNDPFARMLEQSRSSARADAARQHEREVEARHSSAAEPPAAPPPAPSSSATGSASAASAAEKATGHGTAGGDGPADEPSRADASAREGRRQPPTAAGQRDGRPAAAGPRPVGDPGRPDPRPMGPPGAGGVQADAGDAPVCGSAEADDAARLGGAATGTEGGALPGGDAALLAAAAAAAAGTAPDPTLAAALAAQAASNARSGGSEAAAEPGAATPADPAGVSRARARSVTLQTGNDCDMPAANTPGSAGGLPAADAAAAGPEGAALRSAVAAAGKTADGVSPGHSGTAGAATAGVAADTTAPSTGASSGAAAAGAAGALALDAALPRIDLRPAPGAAADRSAAEATLNARPGSTDFAPQLGTQLAVWVREGVHEARLQLNPADMGPVRVEIHLDGAAAKVSFSADNADTRQALQAALPTLAGSLREAGLTLAGGGVFDQPQRPGNGQPGGESRAGRSGTLGAAGSGVAIEPPGPLAPRRRGVVDLIA